MPSLKDKLYAWIDDIPDNKLDSCYVSGRPIHTDRTCRLDCQGITSDDPKRFNLQVQVNNSCPDTTMKKLKPKTVAWCLCPIDEPWTAEQTKKHLKASVTGGEIKPPKVSMSKPAKKSEEKVEEKTKSNPNKARKR